jgi:hypothetical protein
LKIDGSAHHNALHFKTPGTTSICETTFSALAQSPSSIIRRPCASDANQIKMDNTTGNVIQGIACPAPFFKTSRTEKKKEKRKKDELAILLNRRRCCRE